MSETPSFPHVADCHNTKLRFSFSIIDECPQLRNQLVLDLLDCWHVASQFQPRRNSQHLDAGSTVFPPTVDFSTLFEEGRARINGSFFLRLSIKSTVRKRSQMEFLRHEKSWNYLVNTPSRSDPMIRQYATLGSRAMDKVFKPGLTYTFIWIGAPVFFFGICFQLLFRFKYYILL